MLQSHVDLNSGMRKVYSYAQCGGLGKTLLKSILKALRTVVVIGRISKRVLKMLKAHVCPAQLRSTERPQRNVVHMHCLTRIRRLSNCYEECASSCLRAITM